MEKQIRAHNQIKLNKLAKLEGEAVLDTQKKTEKVPHTSCYAIITLKKLGWKRESEILEDDIASDFYVEIFVKQKQSRQRYHKVVAHENAIYY